MGEMIEPARLAVPLSSGVEECEPVWSLPGEEAAFNGRRERLGMRRTDEASADHRRAVGDQRDGGVSGAELGGQWSAHDLWFTEEDGQLDSAPSPHWQCGLRGGRKCGERAGVRGSAEAV